MLPPSACTRFDPGGRLRRVATYLALRSAAQVPAPQSSTGRGAMEGPSDSDGQVIPSTAGDPHLNSSAAPTDAAGSGSQHVATLRKLLFRRMLVGVNDGRYFLGLFHCVDKQGNIILQDAVEYRSARRSSPSAPKEERCLGLILIPASCRSSCHVDCFIEEQMALLSLCK